MNHLPIHLPVPSKLLLRLQYTPVVHVQYAIGMQLCYHLRIQPAFHHHTRLYRILIHSLTHTHSYITFAPANPNQANLEGSGENKTENSMGESVYCTVLYGKVSTAQYVHRPPSIQEQRRSLHFCFKHFPSSLPPLPLHFAERKPVPIHPPYNIIPDTPDLPQSICMVLPCPHTAHEDTYRHLFIYYSLTVPYHTHTQTYRL